MTDILFIIATIAAAVHAISYAFWLKKNGNTAGTIGVWLVVLIGLAIPTYRLLTTP